MMRRLVAAVLLRTALLSGGLAAGFVSVNVLASDTLTVERTPPAGPLAAPLEPSHLDQLVVRYRCSHTGFGANGPVPAHALVRTLEGRLRITSFARGWDIYASDAPGVLIAVCLR